MIVAVNASRLTENQADPGNVFMKEVLTRLTSVHKEAKFIFIYDRPILDPFIHSTNVESLVMGPVAGSFLKKMFWYNVKLPNLLKKKNVNILLTPQFLSLTTAVPQCLLFPGVASVHVNFKLDKKKSLLYRKHIESVLRQAGCILVPSEYAKGLLVRDHQIDSDKIDVAFSAPNECYAPIDLKRREEIKEEFAGGFEYFISYWERDTTYSPVLLLKGFSGFKKRQKSNMKLLIVSGPTINPAEFNTLTAKFRFRDDVELLSALPEDKIADLTRAAYASIFHSETESSGSAFLNAMRAGVPVLTAPMGPAREICGEAALYLDGDRFEDIAINMMEIFKDEKLRRLLVEKGQLQIKKFTWNRTGETVWNSLLKASKK